MKRTKEWWARLTKRERSDLVFLEGSQKYSGTAWNIPDDCRMCGACGTPHGGSGLCPQCYKKLIDLIKKADGDAN